MTIEEEPRSDSHTLHCLDYIREQLMCLSDITLQGTTGNFLDGFTKNNGHQCRNTDEIIAWAKKHRWDGHLGEVPSRSIGTQENKNS